VDLMLLGRSSPLGSPMAAARVSLTARTPGGDGAQWSVRGYPKSPCGLAGSRSGSTVPQRAEPRLGGAGLSRCPRPAMSPRNS
jgi:hypothetical protein